MAIQTDFTNNAGELKEDQYVKVFNVICDKNTIVMSVSHSINNGSPSYEDISIEIPYDLAGANPLIQSYDYLKQYVYTTSIDV